MKFYISGILLFAAALAGFAPQAGPQKKDAPNTPCKDMTCKLQHIESNAALPQPDPKPTEFTEAEINAYMASDEIKLPAGVQSVRFEGHPGVVTGTARVDFDKLQAGRRSSNPLLSIFSGVHDVVAVAHAHGAAGKGIVHIDSVSLDGVEIPRFVLQMFVEKYLAPKYLGLGLDSQFPLPARIDTAKVGEHALSVVQK